MVNYRLTPAAKKDLIAIWHDTVKVWGREKAKQYLFDIEEKLKLLATKPALGRIRSEINPNYFSFPASSHLIYYLKSENHIRIIAILHKRMDIEKRLQG